MISTQPVLHEPVRETVGIYRLAEEIGRGSVAVVYRATDTLYDREVALKVLHPYFAHYLSFVRHFVAEGREGMRLTHPNIVRTFDAGLSDGVAFIAQELVTGGTLADMVQARGGPFSLDETMAVVEQAAAGLDHAHHLGCLHRNLKPSNLFFAEQGRIQIADFSAAIPPGGSAPANYPVGTPSFMAPEQARGDAAIDQRADIYSLGAIAFLMLTGRPPFEADNPLVLLRKIIEENPPLLERVAPEADPNVAQVISQALAKRPSARYLTAAAFAQALAHGQPTVNRVAGSAPFVEHALATGLAPAPTALPAAMAPPQSPVTMTFTRQTVMLAGMALVTLLLVLAILLASVAPALFRRIAGQATPAATLAVLPTQPSTPGPPAAVLAQASPSQALNGVAVALVSTATLTVTANAPLGTASTQPATPPPTVKMLPTTASTATPTRPATASPAPTPSPSPTPSTTATSDATTTPPGADEAGASASSEQNTDPAPGAGAAAGSDRPAPSGRIAYTVRNLRTDELDTVVYNIATGVNWPVLAAKRQPDFNNQSDLVLNSEGGGYDALVLMRPTGEFINIASAFAEDSHPHWSPNNRAIVFDSSLVGDGRYRLYVQQDTNYGQKVGPLMFDAWEIFGRYPIFLLDGHIAYNGCNVWENASTCGIFVAELNDSQPQTVTDWPGDIPTDNLGSQILAMSDRGGDWNVYLINPASGVARALTNERGADGLATASPDGNFIAFVSERGGKWSLNVMRSDGSDQRKLFDLAGGFGQGDRDWLQERLSWGW